MIVYIVYYECYNDDLFTSFIIRNTHTRTKRSIYMDSLHICRNGILTFDWFMLISTQVPLLSLKDISRRGCVCVIITCVYVIITCVCVLLFTHAHN